MNYWNVVLVVRGIRGRDRKLKTHRIELCLLPDIGTAPDAPGEDLLNKARLLLESEFKSHQQALLRYQPEKHEKHGDGVTLREMIMFDPRAVEVSL